MSHVLKESPSNIRAGAQSGSPIRKRSPAVPRKASLQDSLQALIASTMVITDDCKEASKDAGRIRRKRVAAVSNRRWERASRLSRSFAVRLMTGPRK